VFGGFFLNRACQRSFVQVPAIALRALFARRSPIQMDRGLALRQIPAEKSWVSGVPVFTEVYFETRLSRQVAPPPQYPARERGLCQRHAKQNAPARKPFAPQCPFAAGLGSRFLGRRQAVRW